MTQNSINNSSSQLDVDNIRLTGNTISITSTDGTLDVTSNGTGAISIGSNATAHTSTMGSTNSSSSLRIQYGTGDFDFYNGSASTFILDDAGRRTIPLQPAFLGAITPDSTGALTGDGTVVTCGADDEPFTEIFDQSSQYLPGDGAGTAASYTASVTGKYCFYMNILYGSLSSSMDYGDIKIVTSNRTYARIQNVAARRNNNNQAAIMESFVADMDAADIATFTTTIDGGAASVTLRASQRSRISGWLVA